MKKFIFLFVMLINITYAQLGVQVLSHGKLGEEFYVELSEPVNPGQIYLYFWENGRWVSTYQPRIDSTFAFWDSPKPECEPITLELYVHIVVGGVRSEYFFEESFKALESLEVTDKTITFPCTVDYKIYDLSGRLIIHEYANIFNWHILQYTRPRQLYVIVWEQNNKQYFRKIIR